MLENKSTEEHLDKKLKTLIGKKVTHAGLDKSGTITIAYDECELVFSTCVKAEIDIKIFSTAEIVQSL
uniref:Uncharacterized protein n=1 Tax=viral metagenome TaxID=1070528 RepID=A0A6H1ZH11_9ZZZZ